MKCLPGGNENTHHSPGWECLLPVLQREEWEQEWHRACSGKISSINRHFCTFGLPMGTNFHKHRRGCKGMQAGCETEFQLRVPTNYQQTLPWTDPRSSPGGKEATMPPVQSPSLIYCIQFAQVSPSYLWLIKIATLGVVKQSRDSFLRGHESWLAGLASKYQKPHHKGGHLLFKLHYVLLQNAPIVIQTWEQCPYTAVDYPWRYGMWFAQNEQIYSCCCGRANWWLYPDCNHHHCYFSFPHPPLSHDERD